MNKKSFTLVELLIVIVILGIIAGIGMAVLNPRRQIFKSQEAVLRTNVSKVCAAMTACMGGQSTFVSSTANCNTGSLIGVVVNGSGAIAINEPSGATYGIASAGASPTDVNAYVRAYGRATLGSNTCEYACVTSNNMTAQTVDGASRTPGQVYAVDTAQCIL